jgi:hypothetical protein
LRRHARFAWAFGGVVISVPFVNGSDERHARNGPLWSTFSTSLCLAYAA